MSEARLRPRSGVIARLPVTDVTGAVFSVSMAMLIAVIAAFAAEPATRPWLAERGGLLSWVTSGAFALGAAIGIWSAKRSPAEGRFRYAIPAVAAWGFLDSLEYGLPWLGIATPRVTGVAVTSSEAVAEAFGAWNADHGLGTGLGLAAISVVVLAGIVVIFKARAWAAGRVMVTERRVVDLLVAAATLLVASPLIGLLGPSETIRFASRATAFAGAATLIAAGLAAGDHRRTAAGWRRRIKPWSDQ